MTRWDKSFAGRSEADDVDPLDLHAYDGSLPNAVSSLEDEELRALLVALLCEWRNRTGLMEEAERRLHA